MSLSFTPSLQIFRPEINEMIERFNNMFQQLDRYMNPTVTDTVSHPATCEIETDEHGNELVYRSSTVDVVVNNVKEMQLQVELPGVTKDNLTVTTQCNTIQWYAFRKSCKATESRDITLTVNYGGVFQLPFKPTEVCASLNGGILYISAGKPLDEDSAPVEICVK